ncbi:MAG TPA: hypothetical protein VFY21_06090 [Xanthobacteraceae bacterium]|nr:hypothetical protein [Xanthobacteraceae bacterium]
MFFASTTFTLIHTALSVVGIVAGFAAAAGLLRGELRSGWTALFLGATIATCVTGFLFPFDQFLPSHWVGVICSIFLAVAVYALYAAHLAGIWRTVFVVTAMISLYLNVFVLVVQAFRKVPFLHALAPTESELPFSAAQGVVFLLFVGLTVAAVRAFRGRAPLPA